MEASPLRPARHTDGLWAITSYFNPMGYRRRLENYRVFRGRLDVPLVAVELAYGDGFELTPDDADVLVQLRGVDVLWQKERLLDLALGALPTACSKVVWMDCDVVVEAPDWPERLSRLLDRRMIVQGFSNVRYMPRGWTPDDGTTAAEFSRTAATSAVAAGNSAAAILGHLLDDRQGTSSCGFIWAARRQLVDEHRFYDAAIIGGGDRAMAAAAYGCFDEVMHRHHMTDRQRQRYLAWAQPYHRAVHGDVGAVEGDICSLWHGRMHDRGGRGRHEGLRRCDFDPFTDIAIAENGCWRWSSDKPALHEYVRRYFASRREDG